MTYWLPKWLYQFTFPPALYGSYSCSTSSQICHSFLFWGEGSLRERNWVILIHMQCISVCFLKYAYCFLRARERRRGEEREREKERVRERERLIGCIHMCPDWGSNPQPRYMPWLGIKSTTFWCIGWCSNQLSHTNQAFQSVFNLHFPID